MKRFCGLFRRTLLFSELGILKKNQGNSVCLNRKIIKNLLELDYYQIPMVMNVLNE
jgi:hypothetical protein